KGDRPPFPGAPRFPLHRRSDSDKQAVHGGAGWSCTHRRERKRAAKGRAWGRGKRAATRFPNCYASKVEMSPLRKVEMTSGTGDSPADRLSNSPRCGAWANTGRGGRRAAALPVCYSREKVESVCSHQAAVSASRVDERRYFYFARGATFLLCRDKSPGCA